MAAASKKKSSAKRTPAQKRATARLVAMNKKKKAGKKKVSARRSVSTTKRRPTTRLRGYRYKNPKDRWTDESLRYIVVIINETGGRSFLGPDGRVATVPTRANLFLTKYAATEMAREIDDKGKNWGIYVASLEIKFNKSDIEAIYS